ncbi:MAG TPA: CopG family transcriptional regulator [Rubrobacter sp.]|nr:CopG family transcriptional regulator [Rubrobacter sp.]
MRTTLTLDEDVARELQELSRRSGESFKEVVNEVLRRGLHGEKPAAQLPRFKVMPKACGFRTGVDLLRLNQLSDELEIEDFQRKLTAMAGDR